MLLVPTSHWLYPHHTGCSHIMLLVPKSHWLYPHRTGRTQITLVVPTSHWLYPRHTGCTHVTLVVPKSHWLYLYLYLTDCAHISPTVPTSQWLYLYLCLTNCTHLSLIVPTSHWLCLHFTDHIVSYQTKPNKPFIFKHLGQASSQPPAVPCQTWPSDAGSWAPASCRGPGPRGGRRRWSHGRWWTSCAPRCTPSPGQATPSTCVQGRISGRQTPPPCWETCPGVVRHPEDKEHSCCSLSQFWARQFNMLSVFFKLLRICFKISQNLF